METLTLAEALDRTKQRQAIALLAKRAAINATKRQLKAQGLTRPLPPRDILPLANAYLAAHRAELIEEAKQIVERWRVEGFFGKRCAALTSDAQGGKC
jgi:hypothetical protein